jgi:hypothetical protein
MKGIMGRMKCCDFDFRAEALFFSMLFSSAALALGCMISRVLPAGAKVARGRKPLVLMRKSLSFLARNKSF